MSSSSADFARSMDTAGTDYLLTTTRAVRKRLDLERPVEPEVVEECLRIAMQGPVGAGRGAPRWMVVTDPDKRLRIAELYRDFGRAVLQEGVDSTPEGPDKRVWASALYLADVLDQVPVFVIPCVEGEFITDTPGDAASSYASIIPAAWSFQLALRSRGLGSCWTALHLWKADEVSEILGIPEGVTQIALLPVAYTKGLDFKPAVRPPIEEITFWDTWGATREA